ncbi:hypothetical protein [Salegentibacter salegens]|uniref:ABC transporter permease n=1 Tax=Salegentibacter salegens TaxID=143223 RepID=A0A1M7HLP7_9FLAO|nr:hypothetical protein [Salegentibacter salegens]PRX39055.1 hypothetical protein LY58_03402 [Salegentibacter salegens]SHM29047.1 hypothetical protein SAMN05878281_0177 [Salegentibacter salegens]
MKQSSIFSGKRFLSLLRQHLLHNYMALLLGVLVGFGISFLVIAFLQFVSGTNQSNNSVFLIILIFGYAILGGFYISSAFSSFRNKEKAQSYLMIPGSTVEKFLVEFIFYPLLFLIAFPLLYILAYQMSSAFISMIRFDFIPFDLLGELNEVLVFKDYSFENGVMTHTENVNSWLLWASISFSLAMAFFLGATSFKRYVFLKTLLALVVYIGICVWIFYFLMNELEWGHYQISSQDSYLAPLGTGTRTQTAVNYFSLCAFCWGLILSVISFLKLKEKEV